MAFKMKGSAFKLNNVATKSALKHSGTEYAAEVRKEMKAPTSKAENISNEKRAQVHGKSHDDNFPAGHETHDAEQNEPAPGSPKHRREAADKSATEV